uniref:Uncharacterized protein n=1 Tax=Amphilophus citrinellus TaxID=61819 RepID=A0A3Q0RRS9_AMPCI
MIPLDAEEDFSCPVCHEVFKDPVVLSCSHSFCKDCLQKWCDPPRNLALKNLCEAFLEERGERGRKKLKIFCLDHQQPVCVICRDSKMHNNHRFRPIDEAAQEHREELQKSLKPLKEKLQAFEEVKGSYDQIVKHIKVQAQSTEKEIKEQFKNLHQFLYNEEKIRIANLKEEEEQKAKIVKAKIEGLSREIGGLLNTIRFFSFALRRDVPNFGSLHRSKKAALEICLRHELSCSNLRLHPSEAS